MNQQTISKTNFETLIPSLKTALKSLKGSEKRKFLAQIAIDIGYGGVSLVVKTFNVGHDTVDKGIKEVKSGFTCIDALNIRRKTLAEEKLPNLLKDIRDIIDGSSQIDPKFKSTRLYTRLTSGEIRKQLILQKGYTDEELPTVQTIYNKSKAMGYKFSKVSKTKPLKKNTGNGCNIGKNNSNK